MAKKKKYNLSSDVIVRFVECLQEAMIYQQDIGVLLSEMELEQSKIDPNFLDMTEEYKKKVRDKVVEMEKKAKEVASQFAFGACNPNGKFND